MKSEKTAHQIQHPDALDFTDVEAATVLPKWERNPAALEALFGAAGYQTLNARRATLGAERTIIFLSYENPWGKSGGIAAVANMLPKELRLKGERVVRLSPLHRKLISAPNLPEPALKTIRVDFAGEKEEVQIYLLSDQGGEEWFLFGAESFFVADGGKDRDDPYVYSTESKTDRDGDRSRLLQDALFAAKAVPLILRELDLRKNLVVHAQDWEFAATALTVKEALLEGALTSAAVVLTLHNPYDHGLSAQNLGKITRRFRSAHWPAVDGAARTTVLSRMIPLTDAPVTTVSRRFAQEFNTDPLQTGHFAHHYQKILGQQGIIGVDNGLFGSPPAPSPEFQQALQKAEQGDYHLILEEKLKARKRMLVELAAFLEQNAGKIYGQLEGENGQPLSKLSEAMAVFMMVGRLDPGQKGFDVLNRYIEAMPKDTGRFILSPLSPFGNDAEIGKYLKDMQQVAEWRRGEVVVIPFRLTGVYDAIKAGVTWSLWPSLYEPFGGVTEFYLSGTPVIARAAGGLLQQVIDYNVEPKAASGILYREDAPGSSEDQKKEWEGIQTTSEPTERAKFRLYRQQLGALSAAITQAAQLYQDGSAYGRILANLPRMHRRLSWERSVAEYRMWYEVAGQ